MKDMKKSKREEKWVTLTHLKSKGNASIHALYFKPNWMGQSWHKKLMTSSTFEDLKDERVEEEGDLHLQGIDLDQLLDMNNEQLV